MISRIDEKQPPLGPKVADALRDAGYGVLEGGDALLAFLKSKPPGPPLCSGYRVFPDGTKCDGCDDCKEVKP